ncbi:DUF2637 domain-containing protein [Puerhibacterium puerhi]|uniref:DUF2637 domain-containing protein n=1 Tax=Puerhibacterium puerhi TaxID=2692623 RepID=UPI001358BCC8|nr:DUF2637 domain-containing protein [Puerhibacterium puerhi]
MQHRPARINPDTLPVLALAVVLTAGLAAVSFLLSFAGLSAVSAWAAVPDGLTWAVPVMLDVAILVYTLAVLVHRARGERAAGAWAALALWTSVSVAANAAHAAGVPDTWQTAIGTVVAGLAPVAVLLATHTIARLVVAPAPAVHAAADGPVAVPDAVPDADSAPKSDAWTGTDAGRAPDADPVEVRRHRPSAARGRAAEHRADVLAMRDDGLSIRQIAERVGLGKTTVAELLRTAPG